MPPNDASQLDSVAVESGLTASSVYPMRPLAKAAKPLPTVMALRLAMDCLGLSQRTLAARLKVARSTIQRWLSGRHPIAIETLCNDREIALVYSARLSVVLSDEIRRAA